MNYDLIKRLLQLDSHPESAPFQAAERIKDLEARAEKAEAWNREMVAKAASGGVLDGYREMGEKLAEAETRAEKAEAERGALRRVLANADLKFRSIRYHAECGAQGRPLHVRLQIISDEANAALNREKDD